MRYQHCTGLMYKRLGPTLTYIDGHFYLETIVLSGQTLPTILGLASFRSRRLTSSKGRYRHDMRYGHLFIRETVGVVPEKHAPHLQ